jgi:hypothetical protein
MAQIVYDQSREHAHILVGVNPKASVSLCGVNAVRFSERIQPYDRANWPKLEQPWCRACLTAFAPELADV